MMPLNKLSICMPTYNFGAFIAETLESITKQLQPGVEIVILDGGSTDDTPQVVESFARRHSEIVYVRQNARGGIDRDMARSVDLANGEYCWLFSSDDFMKPGALAQVMSEIQSGFDLYLCGLTLCDKRMNVLGEHPVSRAAPGSTFDLSNAAERARYFGLADTTTAIFSFMGSLIFRRDRWLQHPLEPDYVGTCWAHVVRILRMIPRGLRLKYIGHSLQLKRGENDSFMDKGVLHRYSIAIDGYHRIAADIFGRRSLEAWHIRRVVANEYPFTVMFFTRVHYLDQGRHVEIPELNRLTNKAWCDTSVRNLMRRAGYHPVVYSAYSVARRAYKALRRRGLVPARKRSG
jgi:abequosyltransferase